MKIKEIKSQVRRDFRADLICEHCNKVEEDVSCYDDKYFHENVIPKMKCKSCKETSPSSYRPLSTKYKEHEII